MKFDDESQRKENIINDSIDTHVNELTKDIQEWCTNNTEKICAEQECDKINEFKTFTTR